jgi:hypothetical protein
MLCGFRNFSLTISSIELNKTLLLQMKSKFYDVRNLVAKGLQSILDAKVKTFKDTHTIIVNNVNNTTVDLEHINNHFNKCLDVVKSEADADAVISKTSIKPSTTTA